jgi:hypothetical protein
LGIDDRTGDSPAGAAKRALYRQSGLSLRNFQSIPTLGLCKGGASAGKRAKIGVSQRVRRQMTENQSDSATVGRAFARAALVGMLLMALSACNQFDSDKIAETCVASAMKHAEPFGNAKERAETQAQLKEYCARAAGSKSP